MILGDTSGILPIFVPSDAASRSVNAFLRSNREQVFVPTPCVGELGYMLGTRGRADGEARFLRALGDGGLSDIHPAPPDYLRAAELVLQYSDFPLGIVDALIVAMAERLNVTTILTLDRRHFGAVRPAHCESFTLVP